MEIVRLPAKKIRIFDILNGRYFPGSREEMKAGYVITPFGEKVSRISIVANVTEKFLNEDGSFSSITVDDGTEAIRIKVFKEDVGLFSGIAAGDMIVAIGKIKEYNGEIYVNGEIIKKAEDKNLESLSMLEILDKAVGQKKIVEEIRGLVDQMSQEELENYANEKYGIDSESLRVVLESKKLDVDYKPKVLEVIGSLDSGDGVEVGKLFEVLDLPENIIEKTLDDLLNEGYLYEPKIGRLRKV